MRKETHRIKAFNNTVRNTIKRFSKLEANNRYALLEEICEWIFCEHDESEIDYLKEQKYGVKK